MVAIGNPAAAFSYRCVVLQAPEIAIALCGLPARSGQPWGSATPDACVWAREQRVRAVALDASRPDVRARDLGRSARRDLSAMLRRTELELAGIDLWIPPEHFNDDAKSQRAMDTVSQTAALAGELARLVGGRSVPVVSVTLPGGLDERVRREIGEAADRHGAVVADHTPGAIHEGAGLGVGVDPAACLLAGESAGKRAVAGGRSACLRLSDLNATGRCAVGAEGARLDLTAYAGACLTVGGRWITLDTRGVGDPERAAGSGVSAWRDATTLPGL
jgi:hypothetical protein